MSDQFESSSSQNPSDSTQISSDDKLWVLLAYVLTPILPIIILLLDDKKQRPFIRAHNVQALVWGILEIVVSVAFSWLLCGLPTLALWALAIYWGIKAYKGEYINIPVITDFVKGQGWA